MRAVLLFLFAVALAHPPRLVEVAKEVNAMKTTWIADESIPTRDYTQYLGALEGGEELETKWSEVTTDLPKNYDAATAHPECPLISEIRDQSTCGSCWAFGAASAATDRMCIATNGKIQDRLSDQDLLTCCTTCGSGCNGGYIKSAWTYFVTNGVPTGGEHGSTEWCNAYEFPKCDHHCVGKYPPCGPTQPTPKCIKECQKSYPIPYAKDLHFFADAYNVPAKVDVIKEELVNYGPIEVAFTVFEDFMTYKSGIYQHVTGKQLGGHAVRLVGWGEENGIGYWKIANSWNEDWGEDGYFRIIMGKNECGIEGRGVAGKFVV